MNHFQFSFHDFHIIFQLIQIVFVKATVKMYADAAFRCAIFVISSIKLIFINVLVTAQFDRVEML